MNKNRRLNPFSIESLLSSNSGLSVSMITNNSISNNININNNNNNNSTNNKNVKVNCASDKIRDSKSRCDISEHKHNKYNHKDTDRIFNINSNSSSRNINSNLINHNFSNHNLNFNYSDDYVRKNETDSGNSAISSYDEGDN